jgi:hypothetical protein
VPPSRRTAAAPPPLTDDDVVLLRSRLAAGERPRVVVRVASAAVAAGTRGTVARLGDPKDSEYIVVRLGKDEVPFAPVELGLPGRPKAAAKTAASASTTKTSSVRSTSSTTTARKAPAAAPAAPARRPAARRPARSSRSGRSGKRVPPLVVTLRFRDGGWTVEAQRGARRLSRPTALRPGAVSAFAEQVDDDGVRDAIIETVESCRAVVEARAENLRAELADAEDSLRAYEARPGQRARR